MLCSYSSGTTTILGDFNAKVGCEYVDEYAGPFGLGNRHERDENLVTFFPSREMVISNTWFDLLKRR